MKRYIILFEYVNIDFDEYEDIHEAIREAYTEFHGIRNRKLDKPQKQQFELETSKILIPTDHIQKIESFTAGSKIYFNDGSIEDYIYVKDSIENIEKVLNAN